MIQDPAEIGVGIWMLGICFPWLLGRAAARQGQLAAQLDASRRELAEQALLAERRRIARDVHDFVGHGLAAVMVQVTSARHVLHRDPAAAEEALRSAEEVGRRSMQELRRTVALVRSDDESALAPPLSSATEITALVDDARAGGLAVELRTRGELCDVAPGIGVALFRIAQEALANAARHAPRARAVLDAIARAEAMTGERATAGQRADALPTQGPSQEGALAARTLLVPGDSHRCRSRGSAARFHGSDTLVGQEMLTMLAQPANDEISSTRDRPRSGQPN